ncbi:Aspartate/glutamate leucyltransferase [Gammaproteobacteria bacterium]
MNRHKPFDIPLFISAAQACSYLPGRTQRLLFVDPHWIPSPEQYQALLDLGFRRTGGYLFRPACRGCQRCLPVRLPAERFEPRRGQRRCWRDNQNRLTVEMTVPGWEAAHQSLYARYLQCRHPTGHLSEHDKNPLDFLTASWATTRFLEFREAGELIAVAVTDLLPEGLSAIYTFFDPALSKRGLGTFAIMAQIRHVIQLERRYLYLGYWIPGSAKMHYKGDYRPIEVFDGRQWRELMRGDPVNGVNGVNGAPK